MTTELKQSACFVKGLQTLHTHVQALRLSVNHQRALDDVGPELAIGMPLGKANVVPKLRTLAAHFTLSH